MGRQETAAAIQAGAFAVEAEGAPQLPAADFRRTLAQWATGITVITALDGEGRAHGVTATSFGSLSLDPPLIQWSLKKAAWSHGIFAAAPRFAVNLLAADQEEVSRTFSSPDVDRFGVTPHRFGAGGLPLIEGALAWLECGAHAQLEGGDHTLFIGQVLHTTVFDKEPLLHWRGRYQALANG